MRQKCHSSSRCQAWPHVHRSPAQPPRGGPLVIRAPSGCGAVSAHCLRTPFFSCFCPIPLPTPLLQCFLDLLMSAEMSVLLNLRLGLILQGHLSLPAHCLVCVLGLSYTCCCLCPPCLMAAYGGDEPDSAEGGGPLWEDRKAFSLEEDSPVAGLAIPKILQRGFQLQREGRAPAWGPESLRVSLGTGRLPCP